MASKKIGNVIIICLVGPIITSLISALVWFIVGLIFPPSSSSGGFVPITFSSKENLIIQVILMAILGLLIGVVISLAVVFIDLITNKPALVSVSTLVGAIISFVVPMLFVFAMAADSRSRGAGGDKGMEWVLATILIIPQSLIGALSGMFISILSKKLQNSK